MITLALESTAKIASVALLKDGQVLYLKQENNGLTHSELLLPMVEQAFLETGLSLDDVSLLSCTVGPGSFTGVRIATSMIKGFALGRDLPVVGVSTLLSLAQNAAHLNGIICPVMDARREQVYTALFAAENGSVKRLAEDCAIALSDLAEQLKAYQNQPIYFVGDGYAITTKFMEQAGIPFAETDAALIFQNAASTAILAEELFKAGKAISADALQPLYLRLPQAERERLEGKLRTPTVE